MAHTHVHINKLRSLTFGYSFSAVAKISDQSTQARWGTHPVQQHSAPDVAHKHKDLSPSNQCLGLCQFTFCHMSFAGEIFTRHCASTVKHGIFNAHIRISRFLVRTSFEDHIRDPKSPVGSLRGNFLVCRTCPLNMVVACTSMVSKKLDRSCLAECFAPLARARSNLTMSTAVSVLSVLGNKQQTQCPVWC